MHLQQLSDIQQQATLINLTLTDGTITPLTITKKACTCFSTPATNDSKSATADLVFQHLNQKIMYDILVVVNGLVL